MQGRPLLRANSSSLSKQNSQRLTQQSVLRNIFPFMPNDGCARTPFAMANRVRSTLLLLSRRDPGWCDRLSQASFALAVKGKVSQAEQSQGQRLMRWPRPALRWGQSTEHQARGRRAAQGDGPGSQSAQRPPQSPLSINQHRRERKNCPKG